MKKNFFWMLVTMLALCSGTVFMSCSDKENTDSPQDSPQIPEKPTMPKITEDFEDFATWVAAAVQRCHPYISQFWNSDAEQGNFNLLLTNEGKNKLYLINAEGKREIPQSEWDDALKRGMSEVESAGYYFLTFQNRYCCLQIHSLESWESMKQVQQMQKGTTPALEEWGYYMLHTLYHESFHNYVQDLKSWTKSGSSTDREQSYPVNYEPRIYRKLAFLALRKAWEEPAKASEQYARAKYWIQKYETQYVEEAGSIKETDIVEGTAEYFGRNVIHAAFPDYELLYGTEDYNLSGLIDDESYQLSVAVQLIRRDGRLDEAMKAFKNMKATPIDFLLKDVAAPKNYDESQDATDVAKIRAAMDKQFSESNPYMAPVIALVKRHNSGQAVYLVVNNSNQVVYTSTQGYYSLKDYPGFTCLVNLQASYSRVECMGITVLSWKDYTLFSLADESHLELKDLQDIQEERSPFPNVKFNKKATLTAVNNEESFKMKELPVQVKYGTDELGNKYYVCQ